MNNKFTNSAEVAAFLGQQLEGTNNSIKTPCAADDLIRNGLCFLLELNEKIIQRAAEMHCTVILKQAPSKIPDGVGVIAVARPKYAYALAARHFFPIDDHYNENFSSFVSSEADIGSGATVSSFCVIEGGVKVGSESYVGPGVYLGRGTVIGKRCRIGAGVKIGVEGFGYAFDEKNTPLEMPHYGRVVIGDDVSVGANSTIALATFGVTKIGDHTKINNSRIAHNVEVGKRTIISGGQISGSVKIGDDCWLAPGVTIRNKIKIGDKAMVGLGAVVLNDVPSGVVVYGSPASVVRKRSFDV